MTPDLGVLPLPAWCTLAALAGLLAGGPLARWAWHAPRRLVLEERAALEEALSEAAAQAGTQAAANAPAPGVQAAADSARRAHPAALPEHPTLAAALPALPPLEHEAAPARLPLALRLLAAALAALLVWRIGPGWQALAALLLAWTLLALAASDWFFRLLPDAMTLPLLWAGLLANLAGVGFASLPDAVAGAAAGYLLPAAAAWAYRRLRGREGMYGGDFKLTAALCAWLGWQALPGLLVLASAGGIGAALLRAARGKGGLGEPLAFGPFLAAAGLINLAWGGAF
ncbi:MAG: A24 family peptidase [Candidatus Protistobacter heckmanni]|nr:A24 family peptidase [Candidatus Protistobacter heckmanni]